MSWIGDKAEATANVLKDLLMQTPAAKLYRQGLPNVLDALLNTREEEWRSKMQAMPKPFDASPEAVNRDMEAAMAFWNPAGMAGVLSPGKYKVFHGTQAVKRWYDVPEYKAMMDAGNDIPAGIAESTYPIESIRGGLGGLKMMDGMGPHAGTAAAANERIAKNQGLSPSKAFNKPNSELQDAYILPLEASVKKPFGPPGADAYTETQLQARLSEIAKRLGFPADATRSYSSHYQNPRLRQAQKAVKEKLIADGYDAIPYINSHEDRGSISWVFLDPSIVKSSLSDKPTNALAEILK